MRAGDRELSALARGGGIDTGFHEPYERAYRLVCWRCGVDFDATDYIGDAPCPDCQYDVPGYWLRGWTSSTGGQPAWLWRESQWKEDYVKKLAARGFTNEEIASFLGINKVTIGKWRKYLGIPSARQKTIEFNKERTIRSEEEDAYL